MQKPRPPKNRIINFSKTKQMKGINIGNKNAEKWTLKEAEKLFSKVLDKAKEKTNYSVGGSKVKGYLCHFIGEATDEADTTTDVLKYLAGKYDIKHLYTAIKKKCERNCFTDAKKGIIVPSMAIINLKSNHQWTDRVDTTSKNEKIEKNISISYNDKDIDLKI